jgi:4'-phosphopantetheinyl transferase
MLLPLAEQERVQRFVFEKDRKLALIGQLLIRAYVRRVQGVEGRSVVVRTHGRKPVLVGDHGGRYANGTFNVSHHGEWVVLAADPVALVGVDVMRIEIPGRIQSATVLFNDLRDTLTAAEWSYVRGNGQESDDQQLRRFYRLWTLKESYVKAIGVGIVLDLKRMHFTVATDDSRASMLLDGANTDQDWRFELSWLDSLHPVAVALGPVSQADAEQQASVASVANASSEWLAQHRARPVSAPPYVPFQIVTVAWLCQ